MLVIGSLLAQGPRTVTAALRAMELSGERRFEPDHRVLNRAPWSGLRGAQILLGLLLALLPAGLPIVMTIDETGARLRLAWHDTFSTEGLVSWRQRQSFDAIPMKDYRDRTSARKRPFAWQSPCFSMRSSRWACRDDRFSPVNGYRPGVRR